MPCRSPVRRRSSMAWRTCPSAATRSPVLLDLAHAGQRQRFAAIVPQLIAHLVGSAVAFQGGLGLAPQQRYRH